MKPILYTAAGVAIGYYIAQTRSERDFQARLDREVDEARDFYRRKYMKKAKEEGEDEALTEAAVSAAESISENLGYSVGPSILTQELSATVERGVERGDLDVEEVDVVSKHPEPESEAEKASEEFPEPAKVSVREQLVQRAAVPKVNYNRISTPAKTEEKTEAVKAAESADEKEADIPVDPITKQAFIDNQFGYDQSSYTYFAGDDILADEDDAPVIGAARAASVGTDTLRKLKVGRQAMEGESTIFVRNNAERHEFEVTRSEGKFSDEVEAKSG